MKRIYYLPVLLCIPFYYSCKSPASENKQLNSGDTIPVQIVKLEKQYGNMPIALSGQFTTDDEVMLSFKTGGIINSLLVKDGDAVKKGQLLATLNLTEINAQLQQAKLSMEKAGRDYHRTKNLYADSVATLEQFQNSKTALQLAEQQLDLVRFNRKYSEIRAEKDGYVLKKMANVGQQISPGSPVLQTNGAHSGKWLLKVGLSDQEWATIGLNDPAKIETSALPGQFFNGIVIRKSEGIDASTGTFTAYISLSDSKQNSLASGMFGKAIVTPTLKNQTKSTWKVPYEALLDGDGTEGYVFITNDNRIARKVQVKVAGIEDHMVNITDGLQNAAALIVSGSAYLTDNSPIKIQPTKIVTKP
jgi:RND family efflux transporter MFP subunit